MSRRRICYASYSSDSRDMLAIWLDDRPSCDENQADPHGWTQCASRSDYEARRLAELAHATDVDLRWLERYAAEWWAKIDTARRRKAKRDLIERHKAAQTLIPIPKEVEQRGREAAVEYARRGQR